MNGKSERVTSGVTLDRDMPVRMRDDVLGHDAVTYPAFTHGRSVNSGEHLIYSGGRYPSVLVTPFVKR